jgi:predicted RNA-binding protein YlqC (UPF0109 family)
VSEVNDYVDGDINAVDSYQDEEVSADTAVTTLEYIAQSLCDDKDAVSVSTSARSGKVVLSLQVGGDDMGRIIGRRGRTAQAIRALVAAAGARDGVTTSVDIVD